jgi:hypothetical protein
MIEARRRKSHTSDVRPLPEERRRGEKHLANLSLVYTVLPECVICKRMAKRGLLFSGRLPSIRPITGLRAMAIPASGFCSERRVPDRLEADEFAREIRRLAIDSWRGLTRPDPSIDELSSLKGRFDDLLDRTQAPREAEINRWLLNGKRTINDRLSPDPTTALRSSPSGATECYGHQNSAPLHRVA